MKINENVIAILPQLVALGNVIHQTGQTNFKAVEALAKVELDKNPHAKRYHPVNYLSEISLQRVAGVASIFVSRAGAGSIAEIALWKKPAILIPIPESVSHDQKTNAYAYARTGAAIVLEEENLTPHLLQSEIEHILKNPGVAEKMSQSAQGFTDPDAAKIMAEEVLAIALPHEA
jgi:UDP-N-acetylglucosamine--N-acetylmuramyl-(pentapeptide) pyrophosphoryl-undecaprenol N-acetylglucosamine transferase